MHEGSRKAIIAAFLANLGIAIAKFVGFLITGSAGLLAEAMHSLADTGNQGLLMLGGQPGQARRPTPSTRSATAASATSGRSSSPSCCSASAGCSPSTRASRSCSTRTRSRSLGVAVVILLFAVVLESWSLRTAVQRGAATCKGRRSRGGGSSAAPRQPELPVVLLEDTGALIGLLFALSASALADVTGEPRWDAVGSHRHRRAAGGDRHHPGDRDEGPADRRVGHAGRRERDRATPSTPAPSVAA